MYVIPASSAQVTKDAVQEDACIMPGVACVRFKLRVMVETVAQSDVFFLMRYFVEATFCASTWRI